MIYRSEIDGLRALAIIPVVFFHAGFAIASGGFVGVDIFFVISGYLITTILYQDFLNENYSYKDFIARRALRILPSLLLVIIISIPFAWVYMTPNQLKDFGQSVAALSIFQSNMLFLLESNYFDESSAIKPLLHTWSLSIEEQFYLIFPLLFFWSLRHLSFKQMTALLIFMTALLYVVCEVMSFIYPTLNYYLLPTRMWEILLGVITALYCRTRSRSNDFWAIVGLSCILIPIFVFDETTRFPSAWTMVPCFGAALIITFSGQGTLIKRILSTRILTFIGLASYTTYLWHVPIFAFARLRLHEPSYFVMIFLVFIAFILGALTYLAIDKPVKKFRTKTRRKAGFVIILSITSMLTLAVIGTWTHVAQGFPNAVHNRENLAKLSLRLKPNYGLSEDCEGPFTVTEACATDELPEVVLWGDSFAMHLYAGIKSSNPNVMIRQFTSSSCSPILEVTSYNVIKGRNLDWSKSCNLFNNSVIDWLQENESVEFVILSSPFGWVGNESIVLDGKVLNQPNYEFVRAKFFETILRIRNLGIGVVVVSPTPISGFDIGQCLLKKYQFNINIECNYEEPIVQFKEKFMADVAKFVNVYPLYNDICENGMCFAELDGRFIYRDSGHLSVEGSAYLGEKNNWYASFKKLANEDRLRFYK